MHRYITSDGSISNGLISQVKKGEKHFEVPSWSVYTHVMDGPNQRVIGIKSSKPFYLKQC